MYLFAMPPPPTAGQCFMVAAIFGVAGFASSSVAFSRVRSWCDPVRATKWITIWALTGGMAAALAGPIALRPDAMPHWIGYNAQDTLIRSFLGVLAGIVIGYAVIRFFGGPEASKQLLGRFQFRISELLLIMAFAGSVCAILALSTYVSFFVLLQLSIMVAAFAAHVRSALAYSSTGADKHPNVGTSESLETAGNETPSMDR